MSTPLSPCAVSPSPLPCRGAMQPTDTLSLRQRQQPTATGTAGTVVGWDSGRVKRGSRTTGPLKGWVQTGRLTRGSGLGEPPPGSVGSGQRGAGPRPLSQRAPDFFSHFLLAWLGRPRHTPPPVQFSSDSRPWRSDPLPEHWRPRVSREVGLLFCPGHTSDPTQGFQVREPFTLREAASVPCSRGSDDTGGQCGPAAGTRRGWGCSGP